MQETLNSFDIVDADQIPELLKLVDLTLQKLSTTITFVQRPKKQCKQRGHIGQAGNLARMLGYAMDQNLSTCGFAKVRGKIVFYSTEHSTTTIGPNALTVTADSLRNGYIHSINCFNSHDVSIRIFRDDLMHQGNISLFGNEIARRCESLKENSGTALLKRHRETGSSISTMHLPQPATFSQTISTPPPCSPAAGQGGNGLGSDADCAPVQPARRNISFETVLQRDPKTLSDSSFELETTEQSRPSAPPPPAASCPPPPPPPPPPSVGTRFSIQDIDMNFGDGQWGVMYEDEQLIYMTNGIFFAYAGDMNFDVTESVDTELFVIISRPLFLPQKQVRLIQGERICMSSLITLILRANSCSASSGRRQAHVDQAPLERPVAPQRDLNAHGHRALAVLKTVACWASRLSDSFKAGEPSHIIHRCERSSRRTHCIHGCLDWGRVWGFCFFFPIWGFFFLPVT